MMWLARVLAGPILWAVMFSLVYALHGAGCNLGWTLRPAPIGDLHHFLMWTAWVIGIALHVLLLRILPEGEGRARQLIVLGAWIGLVSTVFTLFPVIATSTCQF